MNPEIEGETLKAIQEVVRTVYGQNDKAEEVSEPRGIVTEISDECLELMNEPEKSQAIPACKVVASLIGTTRTSSTLLSFRR